MATGTAFSSLLMLLLLRGGSTDLLDYVETQRYWQAKGVAVATQPMIEELRSAGQTDAAPLIEQLGSVRYVDREAAQARLLAMGPRIMPQLRAAAKNKDAEIACRVRTIMDRLGEAGQGRSVRLLMAIRTLGELKAVAAVPALEKFLDSKERFAADYAAAALASIRGESYTRGTPEAKAWANDLALLPADCTVVGQARFGGGAPIRWETLLGAEHAATAEDLTPKLIALAEAVGNVRLKAVTFGISRPMPHMRSTVWVARGTYDREAIRAFLRRKGFKPAVERGVEVFTLTPMSMLFPADDRVVLVTSLRFRGPNAVGEVVGKLVQKDPLKLAPATAQWLAEVDRSKPLWLAARQANRASPLLVPGVQQLRLLGERGADGVRLDLFLRLGENADATRTAGQLKQLLTQRVAAMRKPGQSRLFVEPLAQCIQDAKVEEQADGVRITGLLKAGSPALALLAADKTPETVLAMGLQGGVRVRHLGPNHVIIMGPGNAVIQQEIGKDGNQVVVHAGVQGGQVAGQIRIEVRVGGGNIAPVPVARQLVQLTGTVSLNGRPLAAGKIQFKLQPDGKASPVRVAGGSIRNGQFRAMVHPVAGPGDVAGKYKVIITPSDAKLRLPDKYTQWEKTELTADVKADGPNQFQFELVVPKLQP